MRIDFDPTNAAELAAISALIASLRGESAPTYLRPIDGTLHAVDEQVDPAAAFGGQAPEQAFTAAPFVSPAPVADIAGEPVGSTATTNSAPAAASPIPPAPPAASPAAPSSGVDLDADGLPWDGRIHSGPADKKPKNADGRWRGKRGASDDLIAQVQAELRQVMGAPAAAPNVPAPPVVASPAPAPAAAPIPVPPAPTPTLDAAGMAYGADVATTAPSPAPAPPVPAAGPVVSFTDLMRKITAAQTSGTLTVDATSEIARALGLTGVRDLINRSDLVASFDALLPA